MDINSLPKIILKIYRDCRLSSKIINNAAKY
jgi:hypothetical protein